MEPTNMWKNKLDKIQYVQVLYMPGLLQGLQLIERKNTKD